ncbi:MAG: NAD(P)/FAD-dependent oxidoreductase, partial [Desulfocapsaceae bacterium]|nr:NAD(P)/FAD-dependent oxidoreductase [Desulfocapsaceae bacterium]
MHYDAIIIGAGPGGLACATRLARDKNRVLVVERKSIIGPKACAGGITYSGLLQWVPKNLIERTFPNQLIATRYQNIQVSEKSPIVATICRSKLGQFMAKQAAESGVDIVTSTLLEKVDHGFVTLLNLNTKERYNLQYEYLIGADGSTSRVRK